MNVPLYVAIMAALVLMSGYFSATETAFSSFNKTRLKTLAEKGNKKAKLALKLEERYDRLLSTILIGNNIVNIALASLGTLFFVHLCGGDQDLGATLSTVVITVAVLIFGEITPKNLAKDHPEAFAMFSGPIIRFIGWITENKAVVGAVFNKPSVGKGVSEAVLNRVEVHRKTKLMFAGSGNRHDLRSQTLCLCPAVALIHKALDPILIIRSLKFVGAISRAYQRHIALFVAIIQHFHQRIIAADIHL